VECEEVAIAGLGKEAAFDWHSQPMAELVEVVHACGTEKVLQAIDSVERRVMLDFWSTQNAEGNW